MRKIFLSFTLMAISAFAFSQGVKNEVEKRIKKEEMPTEAIRTLQNMPINLEKTKFYLEKDNEHRSFEAKVKYDKYKYSIELKETGALHDIEVEITFDEIPEKVSKTIEKHLNTIFERHKIEKVQQQFSPSNTKDAFGARKNPDKYELIVATKNKDNKLEEIEIRFDSTGKDLETRKVIRRSYEFLLF